MFAQIKQRLIDAKAKRIFKQSRYSQQLQDLPESLFPIWRTTAKREFPGIPSDAIFFARAAEGLMTFFDCAKRSSLPCALPSRAADSVWHVWAALSPIGLDAFCRKHFGREIPHVEATQMPGKTDEALAACLVQARKLQGLFEASNTVPNLFALDRVLKMPNGYAYQTKGAALGFRDINRQGEPQGAYTFPDAFKTHELLALGLISAVALEAAERRLRDQGSAAYASDTGSTDYTAPSSRHGDGGSSDCNYGDASASDCASGADSGSAGSSCGSSCGSSS